MGDGHTRIEQNDPLTRMAAISLQKGYKPFLSDFNPETSEREKRKLSQRSYQIGHKKELHNERGIFVQTGEDLCDCLERNCPGCHFPCTKCKSPKCGHECRCNRKWAYESVEYQGIDDHIKNPYYTK